MQTPHPSTIGEGERVVPRPEVRHAVSLGPDSGIFLSASLHASRIPGSPSHGWTHSSKIHEVDLTRFSAVFADH